LSVLLMLAKAYGLSQLLVVAFFARRHFHHRKGTKGGMNIIRHIITGRREAVERDEQCGLILNALHVLRTQRAVAVQMFGARDPHIAELDAERDGLMAQARDLGAAWA
jgi:hypothetical protein